MVNCYQKSGLQVSGHSPTESTRFDIIFRHVPSILSTVSHIAFSPSQNLLAWTDAEGTLTRWPNPIPNTSPDPVKATASASNVGVPAKKKRDPFSFDEEDDPPTTKGKNLLGVDENDPYDLGDDDWMIDDLGILDDVEKDKDKAEGGFAREMGMSHSVMLPIF